MGHRDKRCLIFPFKFLSKGALLTVLHQFVPSVNASLQCRENHLNIGNICFCKACMSLFTMRRKVLFYSLSLFYLIYFALLLMLSEIISFVSTSKSSKPGCKENTYKHPPADKHGSPPKPCITLVYQF